MFSDQINAAQVGVPGDACTTCGSALSPDQRYCLSCGTRRSGANLHFQQILAAEAAAQAPAVSTAQAAGGAGAGGAAPRSSMPALASIACLLLALGVIPFARNPETPLVTDELVRELQNNEGL